MSEEKKPRSFLKTLMTIILTVIITILILIVIIVAYVFIKNPFDIRGVVLQKMGFSFEKMEVNDQDSDQSANSPINNSGTSQIPASSLPISDAQQKALESAGVDPSKINITPEMEACFIDKLGEQKVEEIKNGAVPGPLDMLKASSCL